MSKIKVILLLFILIGAAEAAAAPADDERIARGSIGYRVHCSNCHGDDGTGQGPMAELLKVLPTDLTTLSERHDGEFPHHEVYRIIDGRSEIPSHGRSGMPVWGLGLQEPGRDHNQEESVREQILDLVAYLESLQKR